MRLETSGPTIREPWDPGAVPTKYGIANASGSRGGRQLEGAGTVAVHSDCAPRLGGTLHLGPKGTV